MPGSEERPGGEKLPPPARGEPEGAGGAACSGRPEGGPPAPTSDPPGLPEPETVVSETEFTSPKGRRYRILRTTQKDEYDPPDPPEPPPCPGGRDQARKRE